MSFLCWLENTHNMSNFYLPNYILYHKTEKCGHGGLMIYIYVHNQYIAKSLLIDEGIHGWERQYIELSHKRNNMKKYIICNVYKPPNLLINGFNIFNN